MRILPLLALLVACADPSKDKTAAVVHDAPPPAPPAAAPAPSVPGARVPLTGEISFVGAKVTNSHPGKFAGWTGSAELDGPNLKGVEIEVDVASLATDAPKLDEHLRSPDFFDVGAWPKASFRSTSIVAGAPPENKLEGATHTVSGDLTLRDVTKAISVPAIVTAGPNGLSARTEFFINRKDFGIVYPGKPDDLIKDEVAIALSFTAGAAPVGAPPPAGPPAADAAPAGGVPAPSHSAGH